MIIWCGKKGLSLCFATKQMNIATEKERGHTAQGVDFVRGGQQRSQIDRGYSSIIGCYLYLFYILNTQPKDWLGVHYLFLDPVKTYVVCVLDMYNNYCWEMLSLIELQGVLGLTFPSSIGKQIVCSYANCIL